MPSQSDHSAREQRTVLQKALLAVIRLLKNTCDQSLIQALDALHTAATITTDPEALNDALTTLTDEIERLKSCESPPAAKGAADPDMPSEADFLEVMRNFYLETLTSIHLELDPEYLAQIHNLKKRISRAEDFSSMIRIRPHIDDALRRFAHQVFEERSRAVAFMSEVAQRLGEMERHLVSSIEHFRKTYQTETEFNRRLSSEIKQTSTTVRNLQQVEQLKNLVLSKLSLINEAIKTKQQQESDQIKAASRDLGTVRNGFGSIQEEIKRVHAENQALMKKLRRDGLTGAYNRTAYEEHLADEFERMRRYERTFSLIIFDIDEFKSINDTFGHIVGDRCLREVARQVGDIIRQNDVLARYGGDEFVVLLPETNKLSGLEVAEKIRQRIEMTEFTFKGSILPMTISLGVTAAEPTDENVETVVHRADQAMYEAKRGGKNRIGIS